MRIKKVILTLLGIGIASAAGLAFLPDADPNNTEILPISFNGTQITFTNTDDNTNENLIIKTDRAEYRGGWNEETMYFAVKNISPDDQDTKIQCLFEGGGRCDKIEEFKPQVPYEETVTDYGPKDYTCKNPWTAVTGTYPNTYACGETKRFCDSASGKICTVNKDVIAKRQETRYRDEWGSIAKTAVEDLQSTAEKKAPEYIIAKDQISYWIPSGETKYFRALLTFGPEEKGKLKGEARKKFFITATGHNNSSGVLDPWYGSAGWGYRMTLTINDAQASSTQTNFPVLISTTTPNLKTVANGGHVGKDGGTDILITSSDGTTKLDHEIERYASTTGETIIWVEVPTINDGSDTTLYLYYGNSGASDQQNATGVWDSNYAFVLHVPNGTTLSPNDSTSNSNNFTAAGSPSAAAGQIDGAFNASSNSPAQYLTITGNASLDSTSYTLEGWMRINGNPDSGSYDSIMQFGNQFFFYKSEFDNKLHIDLPFVANDVVVGATTLSDTTWYHVVATRNSTTYSVYLNGTVDGNNVNASTPGADADFHISSFNGAIGTNGYRDELRYSKIARSSSWIKTEYNNQSNPGTFMTWSVEESEPVTGSTPRAIFQGNTIIKGNAIIQ